MQKQTPTRLHQHFYTYIFTNRLTNNTWICIAGEAWFRFISLIWHQESLLSDKSRHVVHCNSTNRESKCRMHDSGIWKIVYVISSQNGFCFLIAMMIPSFRIIIVVASPIGVSKLMAHSGHILGIGRAPVPASGRPTGCPMSPLANIPKWQESGKICAVLYVIAQPL